MLYTQNEIIALVIPVLKQYPVKRAAFFGSYARNEQTQNSDIDLLLDLDVNEAYPEFYYVYDLLNEIEAMTGKRVDHITTKGLASSPSKGLINNTQAESMWFYEI